MKTLTAFAAALVILGYVVPSFALDNGFGASGVDACKDWCLAHNKTVNSRLKCFDGCDDYWSKHKGISALSPDADTPPRHPIVGGATPAGPQSVN